LYLKTVANLIQELGGCAAELLPNDTILLSEDLKDILQWQCDRISPIEKQVILLLAQESEPVNLAKLIENSLIPTTDLLNALQSLSRRCLIEQQANSYTLLPIIRQYIQQIN
jgi:DNA-binding MarR family transcriptional regulator